MLVRYEQTQYFNHTARVRYEQTRYFSYTGRVCYEQTQYFGYIARVCNEHTQYFSYIASIRYEQVQYFSYTAPACYEQTHYFSYTARVRYEHSFSVTLHVSVMKRRVQQDPHLVQNVGVGPRAHQQLDHTLVPFVCRNVQSSLTLLLLDTTQHNIARDVISFSSNRFAPIFRKRSCQTYL